MNIRWLALIPFTLGCCQIAAAQQVEVASTELNAVLAHLGEQQTRLEHFLPNFTCGEDVTSQEVRNGKVRRSIQVHGTLRMKRDNAGHLSETYTFDHTTRNPFAFAFGRFTLPAYLSGGFDSAMSYFSPSRQACFRYTLTPGGIAFAALNGVGQPAACTDHWTRGFALLNSSGEATHVERTVPPDVAGKNHVATFAAINFLPVEMNGTTYRLSHSVVADMVMEGGSIGHFEATYSSCKLFTTSITLGPATELPPETPVAPK